MRNLLIFFSFLFLHMLATAQQESNDELLINLNQYILGDPVNPYYYKARGDLLVLMSKNGEAIDDYNDAIKLHPSYYEAYKARGVAEYKSQSYQKALDDFNLCLEKFDTLDYDLYFNRALVFHDLKEFSAAISDYEKVLELQKGNCDALYNKGLVLSELKRYAEAEEMFSATLKSRPNHALAIFNRGHARYEQGEFKEALKDFEESLNADKSLKVSLKWIGLCYQKLNDLDRACFYFKKAKNERVAGMDEYIHECN